MALVITAAALALASAVAAAQATNPTWFAAADMSALPTFDCSGSCSQYRWNSSSIPGDALDQLAMAGLNAVRLRVWVNPQGSFDNATYCNATNMAALARRVARAGLHLWLDFHYSDTWADPGHQIQPAGWLTARPASVLAEAVYNYTADVLQLLAAQGTVPSIVQVGNEITNGMLWAPAGGDCSDGGYLGRTCPSNGPIFASFVAAGIRAVRAIAPAAVVMIHTDMGNRLAVDGGAKAIVAWYVTLQKELVALGVDFDAVGLSCYPHWGFGNTTNLGQVPWMAEQLPGKQWYVAETAYPYSDGSSSPTPPQFPYTPAGQAEYVRSVLAEARAANMSGVAWWGSEYIWGSGAGLTALWDEQYVATEALTQGWS